MTALAARQAPDAAPFARIAGVTKLFANGTLALQDVNLAIEQGSFVSLLGPSGCGKSTLLRILAGLALPSSGSIEVPGNLDVGFVFQEPTLMPWKSVLENVSLPLKLGGAGHRVSVTEARLALSRVGLTDFDSAYPRELSGGMKMRVSIARAIVTRPRVLLLDEPFAALDEITRLRLIDDLYDLWTGERFSAVFVTHSVSEAVYLSQRVCVMAPRPGRIIGDYAITLSRGMSGEQTRASSAYHEQIRTVSQCLREGARS